MPLEKYPDLRVEFRVVQLLTFTVISRCCSPSVRIALKPCWDYLDAGHQAWHFIESTYQREQSSSGRSSGGRPAKDTDKQKSAKESGRGGGGRRREWWVCGDPDHLSFECPDCSDLDDEDAKGGRGRSAGRRPLRESKPCREKQSIKSSTSMKDAHSSAEGKGRDDKEASCSLVGVVELTISLAPEACKDFQAMAAAMKANPLVVLPNSGCSHHLMGTKEVFLDLQPSGDVKHECGFNEALQDVQGRGTVALQGEAGKQVLIPNVLYVPCVHANVLSAGQLKENGVKLQEDGDEMLLVSATGDVLGRASYTCRVLFTDLRPCLVKSTSPTMEVVALWAIVSATKSMPDRLHARLAHVCIDTIQRSAKHEVAIGLDLKPTFGSDSPRVSCIGDRPQPQNGMAEREMRMVVKSVWTMLLHMGVQHHWWHLALRQAVKFLVPEQQRGGKLKPKARWALHLGVSEASKGWELLDIANNLVVTLSDVVFYDTIPPAPPLVANLCGLTPVSVSGDEGRSGASPVEPAKSITGGRRDAAKVGMGAKLTPTREQAEKVQPN
ncbi:unnamed protein product [Closterium sp. NIES-64]|nr:unnamed protein product [Closterium sp. NIES-64]